MNSVRALLFDVFGTVVEWRQPVATYLLDSCSTTLSSSVTSIPSVTRARASVLTLDDWTAFAEEWRHSYYKFTRSYDPAAHGGRFMTIDEFHEKSLGELLEKNGLDGLWAPEQLQQVSLIWHRLPPWADCVVGLTLLGSKFPHLGTLSNGNTALLTDLAGFGSLPFTDFFSAQDFGAYKPHPTVYDGATAKLGLQPAHCAMVAAHLGDLKAAKGRGMKTIYIERPGEEGWDQEQIEKAKTEGWVDLWVESALDGDDGSRPRPDGGMVEAAKRLGITVANATI